MPTIDSDNNNTSFDQENENYSDAPLMEKPIDEFSGIDVIISTPESLEDVKRLLEDANMESKEADQMMAEAEQLLKQAEEAMKKAQEIKEQSEDRIKQLSSTLANIEQNRRAEIDEPIEKAADFETSTDNSESNLSSADDTQTLSVTKPRKKSLLYAAVAAIAVIVLLILLFTIPNKSDKLQQDESVAVENKDSVNNGDKTNIKNATAVKDSASNTPKRKVDKVTFDGYTPFEIIVVNHYGDRKHMKEVLDYNIQEGAFKDWANIPIGTEILLPEF